MASPPTIDLDALLAPISEDQPVGEDLRGDATYTSIKQQTKDTRRQERDQTNEEESPQRAAWSQVQELAQEILSKKSKNLEVVTWLTEALVRLQGFAGLRDSFRLARGLIERYWNELPPRDEKPERDEPDPRLAQFAGLNGQGGDGTLIVPIRRIPLTKLGDDGSYAQWHYQKAIGLQGTANPDDKQRASELLAAMEQAAAQTDLAFFERMRDDLRECQDEFGRLCGIVDEKCGTNAPPFSNIRNALEDCRKVLRFLAGNRLSEEDTRNSDAESDRGNDLGAGDERSDRKAPATGTLATREDAFASLLQLAAYFRNTEPHSPVSYLLEQAVRWGRMPLPELWHELITDDQARGALFRLTGIRPPAE